MKTNFNLRQFIIITLITSLWINLSEVFRYFILVMPKVKSFFNDRAGVAEMDWGIFFIWGLWDTLLTAILVFLVWTFINTLGNNQKSIFLSGTITWLAVFVIFWVATANMGLSEWNLLFITLPLSWIEMLIGAWIASALYKMKQINNL